MAALQKLNKQIKGRDSLPGGTQVETHLGNGGKPWEQFFKRKLII